MTVSELIEKLNEYDGDMVVRFSFDYGDRNHTHIAREVNEINIERVRHNSYVGEIAIASDNDDDDDVSEDLVLS